MSWLISRSLYYYRPSSIQICIFDIKIPDLLQYMFPFNYFLFLSNLQFLFQNCISAWADLSTMSAIDNSPMHSHLWILLILTIVHKTFGAYWFFFFTRRFVAQASFALMTDILEKLRIFPECPATSVCQHYKYAERPWAIKTGDFTLVKSQLTFSHAASSASQTE